MSREDLEAKARVLGVSFNSRTSDTVLEERIADASEAPEPVERVTARVICGNVWSSEGKHLKGEEYAFLPDDFALLDANDQVKRV